MHWATATSIGLHVGGGMALLLYSFWGIQKLEPRYTPIVFNNALAVPPAPPPPPPPAGGSTAPRTKQLKPRQPKELVQPIQAEKRVIEEETAGEPGGREGGQEGGDPDGEIGGILGGVKSGTPFEPQPEQAKPEPPRLVAQQVIEGSRIAGNAQITLPEPVKQVMSVQGIRQTDAVVKLCLDAGGAPSSIDLTHSTGFGEADQKILREMRGWRYRPYLVNGKPIRVCTSIVFRYILR